MNAGAKHMRPVKLNIDNPIDVVPRVISAQGKACGGEFGLVLLPRQGLGMLNHVAEGVARIWRPADGADAPMAPSGSFAAKPAVDELMKLFREGGRRGVGLEVVDRSLKGTWRGTISCGDGQPELVLERAVAPYANVELRNHGGQWRWTLRRTQTWFSPPTEHIGAQPTLARAVLDFTQALH